LQNIYADNEIMLWLLISLIIVLFLPNSSKLSRMFRPSYWTLLWSGLIVTYALLDMNKVSEFLYFNF
ncbi:MAG: MBOAT family protein, partial [Campylobacterota bacterium]|nr:MBOAT family protein [Campylobacterota bacterium]